MVEGLEYLLSVSLFVVAEAYAWLLCKCAPAVGGLDRDPRLKLKQRRISPARTLAAAQPDSPQKPHWRR